MSKAQSLMEEKKYKEALRVLQEIGLRNRDKVGEIQTYINICMRHIDEVNRLEEKILEGLKNNDDETTVKLMDQLKALDPKELESFSIVAYEVKKLKVTLDKFHRIMDAAAELVRQGKYQEAIDTYKQGFTFYREEFINHPSYDKNDVADVGRMYIEIDALIAEYYSKAAAAERSNRTVYDLFTEGRLTEGLGRAESALTDLSALLDIRLRLINIGRRFIAQNEHFKKKSPTGKGDNLFYFSSRTVLGRNLEDAESVREGLYFVVESHWESILERTTVSLEENAERFFRLARENERAGNAERAEAYDQSAERFAVRAAEFLAQDPDSGAAPASSRIDGRDRRYVGEKYPRLVHMRELVSESRTYRMLENLRKNLPALNRAAVGNADDAAMLQYAAAIRNAVTILDDAGAACSSRQKELERLAADGIDVKKTANLLPEMCSRISGLLSEYRRLDVSLAVRRIEREIKPLRDAHAAFTKRLAEANGVRDGTAPVPPQKSGERRPSDAIKLYDALKRDLSRDDTAPRFLEKWRRESEVVRNDPALMPFIQESERLAEDLKKLSAALDENVRLAAAMRDESKELYKRAASEYEKAEAAAAQKKWDESAKLLTAAKKDLAEARANEETDAARRLDGKISDLEKRIKAASVDARIAESNEARDKGVERYFLQDFESARLLLERAKKIILDLGTQGDGDAPPDTSDIQLWLDLVAKAQATAPVRVISQKDPLYAEITARQQRAEQNYREGLELKKNGREAEAQAKFQDAIDQIQQIQKSFPQLRESGVLLINILRTQKGETWFNDYINGLIKEAERKEPRQAAAEIEDALTFVPGNRQLKAALERITAVLYEKPVVSAKAQEEAKKLVMQAADLIKPISATRSDYEVALRQVNQALLLDPYSASARDLQTRIRKVIYGR